MGTLAAVSPRPVKYVHDEGEGEGYVMTCAHDLAGGTTDLVILAARDFAGESVARIHLPVRVPLGFHGSWIADSQAFLWTADGDQTRQNNR